MKVVSLDDSGSISICQNPQLASNFVKYFAPPSYASVASTEGKTCRSQHTLTFSLFKSTQILTFSFGFGTTTIPAHHSVGSVTSVITPSLPYVLSLASPLEAVALQLVVVLKEHRGLLLLLALFCNYL